MGRSAGDWASYEIGEILDLDSFLLGRVAMADGDGVVL